MLAFVSCQSHGWLCIYSQLKFKDDRKITFFRGIRDFPNFAPIEFTREPLNEIQNPTTLSTREEPELTVGICFSPIAQADVDLFLV